MTPLPVTAVRSGAEREGPTALVDAVPIALAGPIRSGGDPARLQQRARRLQSPTGMDRAARVQRSHGADAPRISVLLATYERPALLAACLEGFCDQTLPASEFEVVVVDDGSGRSGDASACWRTSPHGCRSPGPASTIPAAARRRTSRCSSRAATSSSSSTTTIAPPRTCWTSTSGPMRGIRARRRRSSGTPAGTRGLEVSPLMHYLTDVDRLLFAYRELRARRADRLAGLLGGARVVEALAARASRPARPAARVLDRRGARVATARSGSRGRLPPGCPQRDVAADRLRRVLPPLRGEGARPGGHRIAPRRPGDP